MPPIDILKPIYYFLLLVNSNGRRITYRLRRFPHTEAENRLFWSMYFACRIKAVERRAISA